MLKYLRFLLALRGEAGLILEVNNKAEQPWTRQYDILDLPDFSTFILRSLYLGYSHNVSKSRRSNIVNKNYCILAAFKGFEENRLCPGEGSQNWEVYIYEQ